MKLSEAKQIIKEQVNKNSTRVLSEGIIDAVIGYIVDKLVKKKTKKYFEELAKDPEFIEAKKRVKQALVDIDAASGRYERTKKEYEKQKEEFAKKYGKKKADQVFRSDKLGY
jgi:hypothetical protein